MAAVSPLAPAAFPPLPAIGGVRFAVAEAGIKYRNRRDVLLAVFDKGTTVAGVFTRSKCPSAPVDWCRAALKSGKARALLVNSGNANAFTGRRGRETTKLSAARLLTVQAAERYDAGARCDLEAGMAKLFASETAMEIALNAVRIHGGYGYSTEFDVERYFRDAPLLIVGEGTNEIQRNVIARQLIARGGLG